MSYFTGKIMRMHHMSSEYSTGSIDLDIDWSEEVLKKMKTLGLS